MPSYSRLLLVACIEPRTVRAVLTGNERAVRIADLGEGEMIQVELNGGSLRHVETFAQDGEHSIPTGFTHIVVNKLGQGSPTTVELLRNG